MKMLVLFWVSAIVVTYNGCSGFQTDGGVSSASLGDAYSKTVHPIAVQHCSECHAEEADFSVAPFFASVDPASAWAAAESSNSINLQDASSSRLVQRVITDQHNCWSGDCEADGTEILEAIEELITLSGPPEPDLRIPLADLSVPAVTDLPDREVGFQTFQWSLSDVGIAGSFTVDIQHFDGSYRFAAPKFTGLTNNVRIKSLSFRVNGVYRAQENTFNAIDLISTEISSRQLTSSTMIVAAVYDDQGVAEPVTITPTFEIIELGVGVPRTTPTFAGLQVVMSNYCLACHSNGGGNQGRRNFETYETIMEAPTFRQGGEDVVLPVAVKPGDPLGSFLYTTVIKSPDEPLFMPRNSPTQIPLDDQLVIKDWINGGASPQ